MKITPLHPFGAGVDGIDLSLQLDPSQSAAIEAAMDQHAMLVFLGQVLGQQQQVALAKSFGPLDLGFSKVRQRPSRLEFRELGDMSNVGLDGAVADRANEKILSMLANQLWHSDSSFQQPRAKYSILYAVTVPPKGGDTEFADLRLAYDALPEWRRQQIMGLIAVHDALHSRFLLGADNFTEEQRKAIPPARWPLVQTDLRTGRKSLFVGIHAREVVGMTVPEGRVLLHDLLEHATQTDFVHRHRWQPGDVVMWDNTATLHRGRHYDLAQRRELRRATTQEISLSPEAAGLILN